MDGYSAIVPLFMTLTAGLFVAASVVYVVHRMIDGDIEGPVGVLAIGCLLAGSGAQPCQALQ